MRKYITLIFALALMSLGLNAQSGRGSGLSGTGLDGFIEQTQLDSIHITAGKFVYGTAGSGQEVTATGVELNYLDIGSLGTGASEKAVVLDGSDNYIWPATGLLTYWGTAITSTGTELNYLDLTTGAGTSEASKAVVLDGSSKIDALDITSLTLNGTAVTATATQINNFVTTSSTGTELDYLDISVLGTGVNTKAVVLDATGDYTWEAGGILTYAVLNDGSNAITSSALEINYNDITTLGTQEASKVVTTDANVNSGVSKVTQLWIGSTGAEVRVLSTAAELDMRALTVKMIDVSSSGQVHVVSPYAGNVTAVYSVLNATIATADAGITINDKDGNVMGNITITYSGSGPGDVDSDVSISNADVAVGDYIEIETDNASTNAVEVEFTILIAIQ